MLSLKIARRDDKVFVTGMVVYKTGNHRSCKQAPVVLDKGSCMLIQGVCRDVAAQLQGPDSFSSNVLGIIHELPARRVGQRM